MEKLPEKYTVECRSAEELKEVSIWYAARYAVSLSCYRNPMDVHIKDCTHFTIDNSSHANRFNNKGCGGWKYPIIKYADWKRLVLGETDKQHKVGDWVLVKGRCGNGLPEDKILKLIEPDHRTVWGHCDPDYYFEWNNELKGLREEGIIRPARPEEIPQEEVEYVECISQFGVMGFTVNKIYRCRGKFPTPYDSGKENQTVEYDSITWRGNFKPSTREAYEAQQKNQFKIHIEAVNNLEGFVGLFNQLEKVNKCSTINTNQNECKNEKGSQTKSPLDRNTGAKTGQSIRPRTPSVRVICESGLLPSGKEVTRTIKSSPRVKAEIGKRFI